MYLIRRFFGVIALWSLYPTIILSTTSPRHRFWKESGSRNELHEKSSVPSEGRMTNAKRFAAGLPPLPPAKKHQRKGGLAPRQSGSPPLTGNVLMEWASGSLAYLAATLSPNGPSDISTSGILAGGRADAMFANLQSDNNGYFTINLFLPAMDPSSDVPIPTSSDGSNCYETKFWYYNPIGSTLRIRWNNGGNDIVDVNLFAAVDANGNSLGVYGTAHSDSSALPVQPSVTYEPVTVTFTQT